MLTISSFALQKRDMLYFERFYGLYRHCAVYAGDGNVIHFNVDPRKDLWYNMKGYSMGLTEIRVDPLEDVAGSSNVYFIGYPVPVTYEEREKGIESAFERVGERSYDLLFHNCHHLCQEITGIKEIPSDKYSTKKVIFESEITVMQNATCTIFPESGADFRSTFVKNVDPFESRCMENACISYRSEEVPSHISWTDVTNHNGLTAFKTFSCYLDDIFDMDSPVFPRQVDAVFPKGWQTPSIFKALHTYTLQGNGMCQLRYGKSTAGIDYLRTTTCITHSIGNSLHTQTLEGNRICVLRNMKSTAGIVDTVTDILGRLSESPYINKMYNTVLPERKQQACFCTSTKRPMLQLALILLLILLIFRLIQAINKDNETNPIFRFMGTACVLILILVGSYTIICPMTTIQHLVI